MNDTNKLQIQEPLMIWYRHNARDLPWRHNKNPYFIWVSEIMLQQTQVDTVIPYFLCFIEALPTVESLANVNDEALYKLWQGLGYYRRVSQMKKAAQIIVDRFKGCIPQDPSLLQSLPGIGAYTAGAITSIAYDQRVSAIDANVMRIFSRLLTINDVLDSVNFKKKVMPIINDILPNYEIGDFNQALMELGALICLGKQAPLCHLCPISFACQAYLGEKVSCYPVKKEKKTKRVLKKTVLLITYDNKIALQKRSDKGLLANLWEPIVVDGEISSEVITNLINETNLTIKEIQELGYHKHIFTHIEWQMMGYLIRVNQPNSDWTWVNQQDIKQVYAIPSAYEKYMKKCHFW